jgi:hypothetical protein
MKFSLVRLTRIARPENEPERVKFERYDWDGMRRRAFEKGELPPEPAMFDPRRKKKLAAIMEAVRADDLKKLGGLEIKQYNSSMKVLYRYRDICVIALQARRRMAKS